MHTSSYDFGQRVTGGFPNRVLCPVNADENRQMLVTYMTSDKPLVIVTPACKEGYDLEGDLCRVQVFMESHAHFHQPWMWS